MLAIAPREAAIEMPPSLDLQPLEVVALVDQLDDYHAIYSPLFQRREQRQHSGEYLRGLLLDIPRKSIEPMALALHGADPNAVRALQMFVSEGTWDDEPILRRNWQEVDATLGAEDGVLILDGSDFPKQGTESVGVKRQYCGAVGKRANCQAGVFLGYASEHGHTLLHRQLYLPKEWIEDKQYQQRRSKCGVPDERAFHTKPQLGAQMVAEVVQQQTLRARWLACDEGFGRDTKLLDHVAEHGLWYFAEVPHDTRVWQQRPQTEMPAYRGRGRRPRRLRLAAGEPQAQAVSALAAAVPAEQWQRQVIKEGSKGPLVADFACLRVVAVRDRLPGPEVWLVLRRQVDSQRSEHLRIRHARRGKHVRVLRLSMYRLTMPLLDVQLHQTTGTR